MPDFDLARSPVRELNQALHALPRDTNETHWRVLNPAGMHAIAAGLDAAGKMPHSPAASTLLSKLLAQGRKTAPDPLHDTVQDS